MLNDFYIYFDFSDEYLFEADCIVNIIYQIDDAEGNAHNDYLHKGYHDEVAITSLYDELKDACLAWLNKYGTVVQKIKDKYFSI